MEVVLSSCASRDHLGESAREKCSRALGRAWSPWEDDMAIWKLKFGR